MKALPRRRPKSLLRNDLEIFLEHVPCQAMHKKGPLSGALWCVYA